MVFFTNKYCINTNWTIYSFNYYHLKSVFTIFFIEFSSLFLVVWACSNRYSLKLYKYMPFHGTSFNIILPCWDVCFHFLNFFLSFKAFGCFVSKVLADLWRVADSCKRQCETSSKKVASLFAHFLFPETLPLELFLVLLPSGHFWIFSQPRCFFFFSPSSLDLWKSC